MECVGPRELELVESCLLVVESCFLLRLSIFFI